jgi:hypothetical protein
VRFKNQTGIYKPANLTADPSISQNNKKNVIPENRWFEGGAILN